MKSLSMVIGIFFLCGLISPATRIVPMKGLVNPDELQVAGEKMLVGEFPFVSIYSTRDFSLLKKFGKEGEGPREFLQYCVPLVANGKIIVSSQGKVSFFNLDGDFISEKKVNIRGASFKPVGDFYGVYAYASKDRIDYRAIDVYDARFKKVKEVYRFRLWIQRQGPKQGAFVVDSSRFRFQVLEDKLVWTDMKEFIVYIWDAQKDQVTKIQRSYDPIRISDEDKKAYHRYFNKPKNRQWYVRIKPHIKFPDYFPPIKGFALADSLIYVYTYRMKNSRTEFFIFNMEGKLIKQTYLLLQGGIRPEQYTFCCGNDKLYQLMESEDGEDWELHITDIE